MYGVGPGGVENACVRPGDKMVRGSRFPEVGCFQNSVKDGVRDEKMQLATTCRCENPGVDIYIYNISSCMCIYVKILTFWLTVFRI